LVMFALSLPLYLHLSFPFCCVFFLFSCSILSRVVTRGKKKVVEKSQYPKNT
jgi:hypothetical protein